MQIFLLLIATKLKLFYLIGIHPYKERRDNTLAIINECLVLIYLYFQLQLTDYNQNSQWKNSVGTILLGILGFSIALNILDILQRKFAELLPKIKAFISKLKSKRKNVQIEEKKQEPQMSTYLGNSIPSTVTVQKEIYKPNIIQYEQQNRISRKRSGSSEICMQKHKPRHPRKQSCNDKKKNMQKTKKLIPRNIEKIQQAIDYGTKSPNQMSYKSQIIEEKSVEQISPIIKILRGKRDLNGYPDLEAAYSLSTQPDQKHYIFKTSKIKSRPF